MFEGKVIDIAVIALNRDCFRGLCESIEKHFDHSGYRIRLLLHVDYVGSLRPYAIENDIVKYKDLFTGGIDVKIREENVGHFESWMWILHRIKNDFLIFEDDKRFIKDITLKKIETLKTNRGILFDGVSLEGWRGRLGNLEVNFYRKTISNFLIENYPAPEQITDDAERTNKLVLKHCKFKYYNRNGLKVCAGTAMDKLAEQGLIRIRKSRNVNSPVYIRTPKNISYILYGNDHPNAKKLREYFLCVNSFPVFNWDNLNIESIKTSHIGFLHRSTFCFAMCTYSMNYNEIKKYDMTGTSENANKLFFLNTEILKKIDKYYKKPLQIFKDVKEKSKIYKILDKNVQEYGVDLPL